MMKIAVTGAAGKLGSNTCRELHRQGHEIVAIDRRQGDAIPVPLHAVDLLDSEAVLRLLDGCEAVVHLANYTSPRGAPMPRLFNENVAMNMNVFHAAHVHGIRRVIFASSIQVVASERESGEPESPAQVAYLPLDSDSPPNPTNGYALSKLVGETQLENMAMRYDWQAVALRLPSLFLPAHVRPPHPPSTRKRRPPSGTDPSQAQIGQAFCILSHTDAARLIATILQTELPGFRAYLPAYPKPRVNVPVADLIETHYASVPLRTPRERCTGLVDITRITNETGWVPEDKPPGTSPR